MNIGQALLHETKDVAKSRREKLGFLTGEVRQPHLTAASYRMNLIEGNKTGDQTFVSGQTYLWLCKGVSEMVIRGNRQRWQEARQDSPGCG